MDENKNKALNAALSQIEKQFGKNTVMRLGDNTVHWISHSVLVAYRRAVSSRFMVLNHQVKPR